MDLAVAGSLFMAHALRQFAAKRAFSCANLIFSLLKAGMAELADAAVSKAADRKVVGVRPPLPAPNLSS